MHWLFAGGVLAALLAGTGVANSAERKAGPAWLGKFLADFHRNSVEVMDRVPIKRDEYGQPAGLTADLPGARFAPRGGAAPEISARLLAEKDRIRGRLIDSANDPMPQSGSEDAVENLLETVDIVRDIREMEAAQLLLRETPRKPWSDSYWPLNKGMTATRYADSGFPNSNDWSDNWDYVRGNPASALFSRGGGDVAAPTEKYDYLMADEAFTLTDRVWSSIKNSAPVQGWEGICDGWAAASTVLDEPIQAIDLPSRLGGTVRFYPSDIKGLGALLWAKGSVPTRVIGTKCSVSNPRRDEVGRVVNPACADTNPGSWHLALVNQVGRAGRPLIIDATYDYEIWNFPVWRYEYAYFNPQTRQPVLSWRDAVIPYSRFTTDKFRRYRSPATQFIIGIGMSITYMIETLPNHATGSRGASRTVNYVYDLELDGAMRVIGGEWYMNLHPDFMWTPRIGARASSTEEGALGDPNQWIGAEAPPEHWSRSAKAASSRLQPLAAVLDGLIRFSRGP